MDISTLPTTAYAEVLERRHFMDHGIKALWPDCPRLVGPTFTVQLAPGDQLMLHAAIYEAPAGSVVVVEGAGNEFAVAGGNVCAVAQKRGIAGFVIDGVIRDIGEIQQMRFPVFARGVVPVPGKKAEVKLLNQPIVCGGATVCAGDTVVADEDGVVVLPKEKADAWVKIAQQRQDSEANISLTQWEADHRARLAKILGAVQ